MTIEAKSDKELLAEWMIEEGFSTGHGDSVRDLLKELSWQIAELRLDAAKSQQSIQKALKNFDRKQLAEMGIV